MKRVVAFFFVFMAACNTKQETPQGILPADKMQSIVWDLLEADELTAYQVSADSSVHNFPVSTARYKSIFILHGTNEEQFRKSFRYYELHPKLLAPVMDSLQKRAARIVTTPGA
jgi:hypothetical protein